MIPRSPIYKAALVIVNAYIRRLPNGKVFSAKKVADLTYERLAIPDNLSVKNWKVFTDQALNKHFSRKIIGKGPSHGEWVVLTFEF